MEEPFIFRNGIRENKHLTAKFPLNPFDPEGENKDRYPGVEIYEGYTGFNITQKLAIETSLAEILYRYKLTPIKTPRGEYLYSVNGDLY